MDTSLIKQAHSLFKMRAVSDNRWEGLLYPAEGYPWGVYAQVDRLFHAAIYNVDGGGFSFHSHYGGNAQAHLTNFVEWINSFNLACPSRESIAAYRKERGLCGCQLVLYGAFANA